MTRSSSWFSSESFFLVLGGIAYWIFSVFFSNVGSSGSGGKPMNGTTTADNGDSGNFFQFLKQFAQKGGIRHMFPGDDSRDSSIQFELISQVHCTTSIGKPISVTVRNTPTDRRRMRMFGGF